MTKEMRYSEFMGLLMNEKKHVQMACQFIVDCLSFARRSLDRGFIAGVYPLITLAKKYFNIIMADIKNNDIRAFLANTIEELGDRYQQMREERRNKNEAKQD